MFEKWSRSASPDAVDGVVSKATQGFHSSLVLRWQPSSSTVEVLGLYRLPYRFPHRRFIRRSVSSWSFLSLIVLLAIWTAGIQTVASHPSPSLSSTSGGQQQQQRSQRQTQDRSTYTHRVLHEPVQHVWLEDSSTGKGEDEHTVKKRMSARARAVLARPSWVSSLSTQRDEGPGRRQQDFSEDETYDQNRPAKDQGHVEEHRPGDQIDATLIPGDIWSNQGGSHAISTENGGRDNEWLVEIGYGTPPQKLKVVLDTGSAGGWLYSPQCCYPKDHVYFDPGQSTTYANRTLDSRGIAQRGPAGTSGTLWNTTYGSAGSKTFGYVGYDTLQLSPSLRVPDVNLALATSLQGGNREEREMEGIIGLLSSQVVARKFPGGWNTPFEKAITDDLLVKPYLSIALRKADRRTGRGGGGQYLFGGVDETAQRGPLVWSPVKSQTFWGITFKGLSMQTQEQQDDHDHEGGNGPKALRRSYRNVTDPTDITKRMVIDTGTALILLSSKAADEVNRSIYGSYKRVGDVQTSEGSMSADIDSGNASGSTAGSSDTYQSIETANPWLIPCQTGLSEYESQLSEEVRTQDFYLELGTQSFAVPAQDFAFWPLQPWPPSLAGGREGMCLSAFQPSSSAEYSIFGGVFLKNLLVILDNGDDSSTETPREKRVGIAMRTDVAYS